MKRGKPLKRAKGVRQEQRRFLIYCEGERTEDQYFKGLKGELRSLPVSICMGGKHGEPKTLVRAAAAHKERAPSSPQDRCMEYDEVWCVIDVEAPAPHPGLKEALELAAGHGIEVALTNPCFELWLLLHFTDVSGYCTSDGAQRMLERLGVCGYTGDRKHVGYNTLRDRYGQAKARAEALRQRGSNRHTENPWTDLDRLVELLRLSRHRPG
ncbi:RloB family protein [Streptomyces sp. DT24]|uniref:RloB family protein n=1 Tax=unclassified Streptomyces TaxID=2593676 RepID=UPI003CFA6FEA